MSSTTDTEASIGIARPSALGEGTHMEFEHVIFDLPHGTFHALQGGDPDGQPTLVLHGFPDHPPTAAPFLAELGRHGRRVLAPWLRGYAPSPTAGPFDMAALTSDVLALIDRWSPGRAVELIGHDWGALTHGADDGCFLPSQVDDRHRFAAPRAREVVPDVGHFLHVEAPEAIAKRIAAWAQ